MKIDHVSLTLFAWEGIPPTRYGAGASRVEGGRSALGLLRIGTDAGITGHAFLGSATNTAENDGPGLIRFLKPMLMGRDPMQRERINAALWPYTRTVSVRSIGAVDVALWDIAALAAGMPLHRLLGSARDAIGAYASSAVLPTIEAYAEEAVRHRDSGWKAYKIHPPTDPATDIKVCEAVRRAVGEDYTIMLDSTWAYDFPAAMKVGRAAERLGFLWYEDPLHDQDITSYVKLKQKLDIPILATEYPQTGLESYAPWIMLQATDYLRGDVAVKGGITTLLKTAHLSEAFRMNYEVHHGGNSLNNMANLHVCCAIRNTTFFEVLLPDGAHKYGLAEEIVVGADGLVTPPDRPGIGAAIDFELIRAKTIAVLE
jgi:L-alanine-DL-glutamate epimerase-like enolase superfamily enzyme